MPSQQTKTTSRVHVGGGKVTVDVNKSGTVRVYATGGGKPRTRFLPKGETHGEIGVEIHFKFPGGKKSKK
jgi:hypothetical protein